MAATKNILRSFIVMALVLGIGFFGLGLLKGNESQVVNQNSAALSSSDVGGQTPQETLGLLIRALEKNDLASAIQYFIPENREAESEDLEKLNKANLLGDLVRDLKSIKEGSAVNDSQYLFQVIDSGDSSAQTVLEIELKKNTSGIWEIVSL